MLISVSGTQGSGKSTLIDALVLKDSRFIRTQSQASRNSIKTMGLSLDEIYQHPNLIQQLQILTLNQKIEDEKNIQQDSSDAIHIVERSYLDLAAYTVANLSRHSSMNNFVNEYVSQCVQLHTNYSASILIVGRMFPICNDSVRPTNQYFADMIDSYLRTLFPPQSHTIVVDCLDVNDRVNVILQELAI